MDVKTNAENLANDENAKLEQKALEEEYKFDMLITDPDPITRE